MSTRTRPDLAFSVSSTAQVLTRDLELLKMKLRHLLQYLSSTKTLGLLYRFPKKRELTEFTIFGDSSFAPSGKHSQSGFTIHLSFRNVRHLIHWQSLREPKIAESSAESELYALSSARKSAGNMRLLIHETFTSSLITDHCLFDVTTLHALQCLRNQAGALDTYRFTEKPLDRKC